jgi:hypothetical protein
VKRKMKKTVIAVLSILTLSIMLTTIAPALAKPNTITVTVKNAPEGAYVTCAGSYYSGTADVGKGSKAIFTLPDDPNLISATFRIYVYDSNGALIAQNYIPFLSNQISGSITIKL